MTIQSQEEQYSFLNSSFYKKLVSEQENSSTIDFPQIRKEDKDVEDAAGSELPSSLHVGLE